MYESSFEFNLHDGLGNNEFFGLFCKPLSKARAAAAYSLGDHEFSKLFISDVVTVKHRSSNRVDLTPNTTEKAAIDMLGEAVYHEFVAIIKSMLAEYSEEQKRIADFKIHGRTFIDDFLGIIKRLKESCEKEFTDSYGNNIRQIEFSDSQGNTAIVKHYFSKQKRIKAWTDHLAEDDDGYVMVGGMDENHFECQIKGNNHQFTLDWREVLIEDDAEKYNLQEKLKKELGENYSVFKELLGLAVREKPGIG
jgi:hypothetical protein